MYMYVHRCMYTYISVCIYIYIHIFMYIIYAYICNHMYIQKSLSLHVYTDHSGHTYGTYLYYDAKLWHQTLDSNRM